MLRFTEDRFDARKTMTIGVDLGARYTVINDKKIRAQIWDTAGAERYRSFTNEYYRGTEGALIVYDITDRNSFLHVPQWLDELRANADPVIMLVGNKCDLSLERRQVSVEDGVALAAKLSLAFLETSALDATNTDSCFLAVLEEIFKKNAAKKIAPRRETFVISPATEVRQSRKKCCRTG